MKLEGKDLVEYREVIEDLIQLQRMIQLRGEDNRASMRIEQKIWKKALLDYRDKAIVGGQVYRIKWKSIGCGVVQIWIDDAK